MVSNDTGQGVQSPARLVLVVLVEVLLDRSSSHVIDCWVKRTCLRHTDQDVAITGNPDDVFWAYESLSVEFP